MTTGRRTTERAAGLALLLSVTVAGPARAAQGDAPTVVEDDVNARFKEGLELFQADEFAEAAALWEQLARDIGPGRGWKLNYNLGLAYYANQQPTLAVERFEAFVQRVAAETAALPPELEERREDAAAKLGAIKSSHGAVVLPPSPGVTVAIDGQPGRAVGFTAYLLPGTHELVVTGKQGHSRRETLEVQPGRQQMIDTKDPAPPAVPVPVPLPPPAPLPDPVVRPTPEEPATFPWLPVGIGAGLTAAGFILPGIMYGRAADKRSAAEELGAGHTEYAAAVDDFESARTAYGASWALPATLGAITLGIAIYGVVDVVTWAPSEQVALSVGPGRLGVEARF